MVARILKSNKAATMKSILTQLHLQQYLPTFQKHDIDFATFLTLNEQTLKIIGVKNESHCKILILWIKKLQQLLLTSTNNNSDVSSLAISVKKLLSEIKNDGINGGDEDKDYEDEEDNEGDDGDEGDDDDDQIIIDERLFLEAVQNNNKKPLTPITEEESDEPSFFLNNNSSNGDGGDDGGDSDDSKSDVDTTLNSATTLITDYSTVPIPEYSEIDLINTRRNHDENRDDIDEINVNNNNAHYYYQNPQSTISSSTLATSASSTTLSSYTPFTTSTLLRTSSTKSFKSSKSSRLSKLSLSPRKFNSDGSGSLAVVESENSNNNNDNSSSSNNNNNNNNSMIISNTNNKSKNKRKHQSLLNPKNWYHSMPIISSISPSLPLSPPPPSYFDIVVDGYNDKYNYHQSDIITNYFAANNKSKYSVDCDNEEKELLPEYSCSVSRSGFVLIKKEFTRKGSKATKRSWKKRYLYLWGTFLHIYACEPVDINIAKPLHQFSMQDTQVELAIDYSKRKYVLRIKFKTGHQYLIQADDKEECVSWIERLQSSCNISSTIDERQMPMFITLPTRRRNNGGNISSGIDVTNIIHNDGHDNTSLASTSLTYQQFNEIARDIQQVQITNSSINHQLSW